MLFAIARTNHLINIDTRDTDKYIWNTPSMWCLAGGQTGRTLVVSLEPTFKWLVLCIYNLFNPPAAQALDGNANWATDRGGRGPGTLSKRPRMEITTWALKHEHTNVQVPNNGIDTPAATQICNSSGKRYPLKRAWRTGHCKSFSREFRPWRSWNCSTALNRLQMLVRPLMVLFRCWRLI